MKRGVHLHRFFSSVSPRIRSADRFVIFIFPHQHHLFSLHLVIIVEVQEAAVVALFGRSARRRQGLVLPRGLVLHRDRLPHRCWLALHRLPHHGLHPPDLLGGGRYPTAARIATEGVVRAEQSGSNKPKLHQFRLPMRRPKRGVINIRRNNHRTPCGGNDQPEQSRNVRPQGAGAQHQHDNGIEDAVESLVPVDGVARAPKPAAAVLRVALATAALLLLLQRLELLLPGCRVPATEREKTTAEARQERVAAVIAPLPSKHGGPR
mmetsp:Transcript_25739/g.64850  ORF Transcript_25739/g.64850 Transcript_25739/m.64850 type:complete len:264 (-) Transcript_25739:290-1081(-)